MKEKDRKTSSHKGRKKEMKERRNEKSRDGRNKGRKK